MKAKMFLIAFLGFLCCTVSAFAHVKSNAAFYESKIEQSDIPQQSRIYVQLDQILVNAEGIFVEGSWKPLPSFSNMPR